MLGDWYSINKKHHQSEMGNYKIISFLKYSLTITILITTTFLRFEKTGGTYCNVPEQVVIDSFTNSLNYLLPSLNPGSSYPVASKTSSSIEAELDGYDNIGSLFSQYNRLLKCLNLSQQIVMRCKDPFKKAITKIAKQNGIRIIDLAKVMRYDLWISCYFNLTVEKYIFFDIESRSKWETKDLLYITTRQKHTPYRFSIKQLEVAKSITHKFKHPDDYHSQEHYVWETQALLGGGLVLIFIIVCFCLKKIEDLMIYLISKTMNKKIKKH